MNKYKKIKINWINYKLLLISWIIKLMINTKLIRLIIKKSKNHINKQ